LIYGLYNLFEQHLCEYEAYDGGGGHHGSDGIESQEKGTAKCRKRAKDLAD